MSLTAKQEKFAQGVADGLNQSDAYRQAYNTGNMASTSIWQNSSTLSEHTHVVLRIQELKLAAIEASTASRAWDVDRIVDESQINMLGARNDKQWSASNGAITTIGKALGLLNDKVDVNVTHTLKPGLSLEQLEDRMLRLNALEAGIIEGEVISHGDDEDTGSE